MTNARHKGRALFARCLQGTPSHTSIAQRDVGDAVPYEAPLRQMRIVRRPALRPPPFAGNAIVFARRGEAPRPADGYGEPSVGGDVGIAPPLFGAATRLAGVNGKKTGQAARRLPCFLMVPVTGLEPVRCRQRWILSPLRLPIPSHRQMLPAHYTVNGAGLQDKFTRRRR